LEFELFEEADRQIQEAQSRGLLGSGEAALLRLRVRARRGLADPALEAARAAAADPEVESFQIAFSVWDAFVGDTIDLEGLLHAFSGLLQVRPGDGVFHFYRGATRFHARDYDGSESDLSAAEASGLLPAQVLEYQGKVFVRQQREEQALTAFQRLQDDFGAVRPAILGMLDVAASLGRRREYDASLRLYEQVLQLDPANEWAHLGAPLCHRGQGAVQDAEAAYLRGLEALPGHAQLLNDLALLLWGAGHQDRARQWFTEAVAAGSLDSAENLGVIARTVDGDPVEAAEYFARVLLDDPQRVKSRFYRELTLWESGESLTVSR
jgi:tetratricopeptide (TPR) repeat protein